MGLSRGDKRSIMICISRKDLVGFAVVALLAVGGLPIHGFCLGAGDPGEPAPTVLDWHADRSSQSLDEVLATMPAPDVSAPKYFGAFGLIGVSRKDASQRDLVAFARKLAADKRFRELVVRYVSEKDCGIQFVYTGKNVDHAMVRELIGKVKRRFGDRSIFLINIASVTSSDGDPKTLGIVTFRPLE
jgi:hypothetical protein